VKASKSEREAERIINVSMLRITAEARSTLTMAIADAIEKAVKAERRACARAARCFGYECTDRGNASGEMAAQQISDDICARGRS
jgi:hypothetical protein